MSKSKWAHKQIAVCVTEKQYEQLLLACGRSLAPSLSDYVRNILFGKPVKILYRDQGYDEFIEVAIQVKKNLTVILAQKWISQASESQLLHDIATMTSLLIKIDEYVFRNKKDEKPVCMPPIQ